VARVDVAVVYFPLLLVAPSSLRQTGEGEAFFPLAPVLDHLQFAPIKSFYSYVLFRFQLLASLIRMRLLRVLICRVSYRPSTRGIYFFLPFHPATFPHFNPSPSFRSPIAATFRSHVSLPGHFFSTVYLGTRPFPVRLSVLPQFAGPSIPFFMALSSLIFPPLPFSPFFTLYVRAPWKGQEALPRSSPLAVIFFTSPSLDAHRQQLATSPYTH